MLIYLDCGEQRYSLLCYKKTDVMIDDSCLTRTTALSLICWPYFSHVHTVGLKDVGTWMFANRVRDLFAIFGILGTGMFVNKEITRSQTLALGCSRTRRETFKMFANGKKDWLAPFAPFINVGNVIFANGEREFPTMFANVGTEVSPTKRETCSSIRNRQRWDVREQEERIAGPVRIRRHWDV